MFENYKDCLFNNKTVYRSQERFKSYYHDVYTEEVNKIVLSSNDDKRLQTSDKITIIKLYLDHRKDLKAIIMMCTQRK